LPSDPEIGAEESEKLIFSIAEKLRKTIDIPIALKISHYSSGLSALIRKLAWSGFVDALVLFNRYYSPDIDIDNFKIVPSNVFSSSEEISTSLRWIALSRKHVEYVSLAATTGIHDGEGVIKQILAGADAVQIASVLYEEGFEVIQKMLVDIEEWMDEKSYNKLDDFRGKMSFDKNKNTAAFERIQFMKHFGGIE
jgi:dihydroorotate dehydrogenase (fumarate)